MIRITYSFFFCLFFACSLLTSSAKALEPPKEFKEAVQSSIQTTTSISQHGITWTFANPVQYGKFVNGDYWVVSAGGGVNIVSISPGHTIHTDGIRHKNGSMIDPSGGTQGFDSYIYFNEWTDYNVSKNVGIGITKSTPLLLTAGHSLVSTISNDTPGVNNASYVKTAAVLTCLSTPPPLGSFRPGVGSAKKTLHNISSVNMTLLKSLPYPGTKPLIASYYNKFKMVWLDFLGGWTGRYLHPTDTLLDNYYYSLEFADAALLLNIDYTYNEKKELLIGYLQLGIDLFSYIEAGGTGWAPDGGHSSGRKWPILFTGIMLNYSPMKNIGQKSGDYLYANGHGPGNPPSDYIHFGEDGQTFYVTQADVDITNGPTWTPDTRSAPNYPYTQSLIGMPEWSIRYSTNPNYSDASWLSNYRHIGTGPFGWVGVQMAALIMDAKALWNHNAFFDYTDRYATIVGAKKSDPFGYTVPGESVPQYWPEDLRGKMYSAYRGFY